MSVEIDFETLWRQVMARPHQRDPYSIRGPDHWLRVERNGCVLANRTGANIKVVRLFALFHDSCRINEWTDSGHGQRGAELAGKMRDRFDISDDEFELLRYACTWHTDQLHHDDPTIGTCWDADRLDIGRAGTIPESTFMSTEFGKEIADYGTILPWMEWAKPHIRDPENHHLSWRDLL